MAPLCSVVLPTFNRMATLPRAVASVLAQEMPDFELIVVDDASTDGTRAWLAAQADPRLRAVLLDENRGPSFARNRGLTAARAPVTAFLDSDDVWRPNRLSRVLDALRQNPDVCCILASSIKRNKNRTEILRQPDVVLAPAAFEWALICDLIAVETSSLTVRTEMACAVGGFCPQLKRTEDREFLIRLAGRGCSAQLLPDVLWEKFWSDDGLSQDRRHAGRDLVSYVRQRPEYLTCYRQVGNYLATKILVADLRHREFGTFIADWKGFRAAGLLSGNPVEIIGNHRRVRSYRRAMANRPSIAELTGPPAWIDQPD